MPGLRPSALLRDAGYAKGVDLATVSNYMGHADVSMTLRNYVRSGITR